MKGSSWILAGGILALVGCTDVNNSGPTVSQAHLAVLPEGVLALAAPNQDLDAVRIDAVDGCYVYRHKGPVETAYLPLRTTEGRPICSRVKET
ncbi:hypothetical protein [Pseudophaeobacter sp. EL27]|uniref:hypothetical protein n=1 Tax=Pseudophaeobacter sp. EL27 TaxID=2107580 RepID=UPI000EFCDF54|nr:hypothetical protein [Pseudophaeobacter sp. EL27]